MSKKEYIYSKEDVIIALGILAEEYYIRDESSETACMLYHAIDYLKEK